MSDVRGALSPRKSPVQARSTATIEALHVAAIQVLTKEGLARCTTTRVAHRAGMSVGSLYQYYPNRDALLAAVLEQHLDTVASAVSRCCREQHDKPVSDMASALVTTFLAAKLGNPAESKALYAVAGERGGAALVARVHTRMVEAIATMIATASDAHFVSPTDTAAISLNAVVGPVRALLEGHAPPEFEACLEVQLVRLLTAYLQSHCTPSKTGPTNTRGGRNPALERA